MIEFIRTKVRPNTNVSLSRYNLGIIKGRAVPVNFCAIWKKRVPLIYLKNNEFCCGFLLEKPPTVSSTGCWSFLRLPSKMQYKKVKESCSQTPKELT